MVDSWYADYLDYDGFSFQSWLVKKPWYRLLRPIIARSSFFRGVLLFLCARKSSGAVVACDINGFWTFLMLRAMFGTPGECFILEFIRRRPLRVIKKFLYPIWFNFMVKPAIRRSHSKMQVMTYWERKYYADMFGVEEDRFFHIPYPMLRSESLQKPNSKKSGGYVMSSGRVACDWETLIDAVKDLPEYQVIIVHSKKDTNIIGQIRLPRNIKLFCEIPKSEHNRLLENAACYVITLHETTGSTGQVRLSNAIQLGIPVIATRNSGLEEFLTNSETAIIVPPADPVTLRKEIQRVMENPDLQKSLAEKAFQDHKQWTMENYLNCLSSTVKKELSLLC